jgi:hypothetical protein
VEVDLLKKLRTLIAGLLLALLAVGCAPAAVTDTGGAATPPAGLVDGGQQTAASMTDEQQAEYWLRRAEETSWANKTTARASLAQAYYLKLIYRELRRQNELLEKQAAGALSSAR